MDKFLLPLCVRFFFISLFWTYGVLAIKKGVWSSFLKELLKSIQKWRFYLNIFEKCQTLTPFSGLAPSKLKMLSTKFKGRICGSGNSPIAKMVKRFFNWYVFYSKYIFCVSFVLAADFTSLSSLFCYATFLKESFYRFIQNLNSSIYQIYDLIEMFQRIFVIQR